MPERWIDLGGGPRQRGRLDEAPPRTASSLEDALRQAGPPSTSLAAPPLWIGGGEPTLRAELPALIRALHLAGHRVGLATDGLALSAAGVAASLHAAGLRHLRLPLHSARADAHDWLVGLPGAARRARAAIRAAAAAGLEVEVEATLCRPTQDHPAETASVAAHLGARAFRLRWLRRCGPAAHDYVALAPRLGLLEGPLEALVDVASARDLRLQLLGLPRCAAPRLPEALFTLEGEGPGAGGGPGPAEGEEPTARSPGLPCGRCPGAPVCGGVPLGYVDRFGMIEALSPPRPPRAALQTPAVAPGEPVPPPPPRAGRRPSTRLRDVHRALHRAGEPGGLGGDPLLLEASAPPPATLRVVFEGSSRELRALLLRAAQEGAPELRVADAASLRHPALAELLRECLRLSFRAVRVGGPINNLLALSDRQLLGLRGVQSFDHVFTAAPSPEELEGLQRLARLTEADVGLVQVIRGPADRPFDVALPLRFRLAAQGGSLLALAGRPELQALLPCALRRASDAELARLPPVGAAAPSYALRADRVRPPDPLDPDGAFTPCTSPTCPGPPACPGLAVGWTG